MPVGGGEHLGSVAGISMTGGSASQTNVPADVFSPATPSPLGRFEPFSVPGGSPGALLNISAQLEPDADEDAYGDETQAAKLKLQRK